MSSVYVKEDSSLLESDKYVYEVTICCYYENYYCIANTTMFESSTLVEKKNGGIIFS